MVRHRKPKYVNDFIDRHGRQRIYFRRPGQPRITLPGPLYSEAFWCAYHAARDAAPLPVGTERSPAGSVSAAIMGYYRSADFKTLADVTRQTYRNTLERFRKDYGHLPLAQMRTTDVNKILDSMADTPGAAAHLRKRLHKLFEYAIGAGLASSNPVATAKRIRKKAVGTRAWSEADIAAYRAYWKEDKPQRLAMEILLYTGLRRSDAVRIGWSNAYEGRIQLTAKKTGVALDIPMHPELARFLESCPRDAATFVQTVHGKARSEKAFTNWITEAARDAGIKEQASPHGLRKAACRRLAEAGCSAHEIMSITGHTDLKEVETYTRAVEQARLASSAMEKVRGVFDLKLANPREGVVRVADKSLNLLTAHSEVVRPRGISGHNENNVLDKQTTPNRTIESHIVIGKSANSNGEPRR